MLKQAVVASAAVAPVTGSPAAAAPHALAVQDAPVPSADAED